ncbi:glycoside hydrolase family 127 protein [Amnibacterium sp.]|uniref:glycoside hydrolase family 127 protein n=1 Tax=Amnibacterium sp. TaxID=1872496 RepID=UPI003F7C52D0
MLNDVTGVDRPRTSDRAPARATVGTPVKPSPAARAVLRPLSVSDVRITGGMWHRWQCANGERTAPSQIEWLEREGTIDNLRRLAPGRADAPERRGLWFTDSDLYKLIEGLAWLRGADPAGAAFAGELEELVEVIEAAQATDGYVNSWVQAGEAERWAGLEQSHELYCIGHLIQAAVALVRATGDRRLLAVATRAADLVWEVFGDGRRSDLDGHEEIEMALVELARETGEARYLSLAQQFVEGRGHGRIPNWFAGSAYLQDEVPVREQSEVVGHAVRAVYLLCGAVDVAVELGDQELLDAAERQWRTMTSRKMYVTGALGSRFDGEAFGEDWELQTDRSYGETCASIGYLMLSWRLLLARGDGRFADAIEHTLYNLFAASTSVDRLAYFYNNPMQRRRALPAADPSRRSLRAEAQGTRPPWFECACCPPNIVRTVASLAAYVATTDDAGVQIHQYMAGSVATAVHGQPVSFAVATEYPLDGVTVVTLDQTPTTLWTLSLRIPAWADGWRVRVNGDVIGRPTLESGYVRIERTWRSGDVVEVEFPLQPTYLAPHPAADGLRGTVALRRGPVVYALEGVDQDEDVDLQLVAVDVRKALTEHRAAIGGEPYIALTTEGYLTSGRQWEDVGYRAVSVRDDDVRATTLRFIPYHLWANRGTSTMRVHVPDRRPGAPEQP